MTLGTDVRGTVFRGTVFRGTVLDTPTDPFAGGTVRASQDEGLLVVDGVIAARGQFHTMRRAHPEAEVVDLSGGLMLPGFVDLHVHYPQLRIVGGRGLPLLDWLDEIALPEEARFADDCYARQVAAELLTGLARAGTTSALVFGAHFAGAVHELFDAASVSGLRITTGLVVSDRGLRDDLHTTPERAHDEGLALARRWHGEGRLRYAVTPRFALSCTDAMLASCAALLRAVPTAYLTSHLNESEQEIAAVEARFGTSYADVYDRHGLLGPRSVLAHDVHPRDDELVLLAGRGAAVAHCPTSNAGLGSGLFPLARHLAAGVRVGLGSDVGAGSGLSLHKEALQAYFAQQLLGPAGVALTPAHLLWLATTAGALVLGLPEVGHLSVGQRFDAQWLSPEPGTTLDVGLRHASSAEDALAKAFALASPADVRAVYVDGELAGGR